MTLTNQLAMELRIKALEDRVRNLEQGSGFHVGPHIKDQARAPWPFQWPHTGTPTPQDLR